MTSSARLGGVPATDLDGLLLELLADREEVLDLGAQLPGHVLELRVVAPVRVVRRYAQDLVVAAVLIAHPEYADRPDLDQAPGEGGFRDANERIEWIAVIGQRLREEAVVGRIHDGGEQEPVEHDPALLVVPFILVPRTHRNLDAAVQPVEAGRFAHGGASIAVAGEPALDRAGGVGSRVWRRMTQCRLQICPNSSVTSFARRRPTMSSCCRAL